MGVCGIIITFFIAYKSESLGANILPLSTVFIFLGITFQNWRLTQKWKTVFYIIFASYLFSFFVFMPWKHEKGYSLVNHIESWNYLFLAIYIGASVYIHWKKILPKLTEGITLIQSIAIWYWLIEISEPQYAPFYSMVAFFLGCITVYVLFHAFTKTVLQRRDRFMLSIWSTIIMIAFGLDSIMYAYSLWEIETYTVLDNFIKIGGQYFLIWCSIIYTVQNVLMIVGYLPDKNTFFNERYFQEIKKLSNEHIQRYSPKQVSRIDSLFVVCLVVGIFMINHKFQIASRQTATWWVFVFLPIILHYFNTYIKK